MILRLFSLPVVSECPQHWREPLIPFYTLSALFYVDLWGSKGNWILLSQAKINHQLSWRKTFKNWIRLGTNVLSKCILASAPGEYNIWESNRICSVTSAKALNWINLSCDSAGIINILCRVQSSESKEAGRRLGLGYCLTKEMRVAPWLRLAALPITSSESSPHKQGFFFKTFLLGCWSKSDFCFLQIPAF